MSTQCRPARRRPRRIGTCAIVLCAALPFLSGCATPKRMAAVPAELTTQASPLPGHTRFWIGGDPQPLNDELIAAYRREVAHQASIGQAGPLPPAVYLSVSGGGDDGAFGAGLLSGWTQHGTRPSFKLVTGVSTGALIAPFAFLGPRYDPILRETYTTVTQKDIFKKRQITAAIFGDAMADTAPMYKLVQRYVTRELLDEIAVEYGKGRLLLVGTTDLDARRPVIWNMTAIAASRDPRALELFRKVILASAAIPAAFPPVMIDVEVDGVRYQEMHVDGGATAQVFMYPQSINAREMKKAGHVERKAAVYIIRNARLDPGWSMVDRRTLSIAEKAVASLIQTQGLGDLNRIYLTSLRDGIDYNLAYIPADFTVPRTGDFQPAYMRPLFERGFQMGRQGYPWRKTPPGYDAPIETTAEAGAR